MQSEPTNPDAGTDEDWLPTPLGLVTDHTVTHTFGHYLCFVLDTDEGEIFQGDLDEHALGATDSAVSVGTVDDEVQVRLTTAEAAGGVEPAGDGFHIAWQGTLECPTGEIGVMDSSGVILMYCAAPNPAPVKIWTNHPSEPSAIEVVVG